MKRVSFIINYLQLSKYIGVQQSIYLYKESNHLDSW